MKPLIAVSIFSLPALLVSLWPDCHGFLCFDRGAIWEGQLWRLWTGHWVHFSSSHLWWNLAAMIAAAAWLELRRPGLLLRFAAVAAPLLSIGLLVWETNMAIYGGLSGVGTGVIMLLGFALIQHRDSSRGMGMGVLALVIAKLSHDALSQASLLSEFGSAHIHASPTAHLLGSLLALGFWVAEHLRRTSVTTDSQSLMSPQPETSK